jgi:glycosidase
MPEPTPASVAGLTCQPAGPPFPSPLDWRDEVIYELMIDRFNDGRDRPPYDPDHAPRGRPADGGSRFEGGTLAGVTAKLDYVKGLGVTAIWLTPALKNRPGDDASYHGYGVQDFLAIDPRFGTVEDLVHMVRQAHDRGLYVIMDIVIDHTGDLWTYAGGGAETWDNGRRYDLGAWRRGGDGGPLAGPPGPDDAVWPVEFQRPEAFRRQGQMRDVGRAVEPEATDADFLSLKKLDLERADVLKAVINVYRHWIAVADIDGFRIDAFRHLNPPAAAVFCNAMREFTARIGKRNFLMVGEVAAGMEETIKYVGLNTPLAGEGNHSRYALLEAVLDFPLYNVLGDLIHGRAGLDGVRDRFDFLERYYRDPAQAGRYYVTFIENHDGGADGNRHRLLYGNRDPRLAVLAVGFLLTSIGIPCIYYGQEQGFDGGGDGDRFIRECMFGGNWGAFGTTRVHFFNPLHPIYLGIAKVAEVRRRLPALRYGRQFFRDISGDGVHFGPTTNPGGTLAYSRVLDTSEVVVAVNLSTDDRNDGVLVDADLTPPGTQMTDQLGSGLTVKVERAANGIAFVRLPLKGRTMAILTSALPTTL